MMSPEFGMLAASFIFLFALFCEGLARDDGLLVPLYVYISDKKWHHMAAIMMRYTARSFSVILGRRFWSVRALHTISAFSIFSNLALLVVLKDQFFVVTFGRGDIAVTIAAVVVICLVIAVHDILSMQITRKIVSIQSSRAFLRIVTDIVLCYMLFVSTCAFIFVVSEYVLAHDFNIPNITWINAPWIYDYRREFIIVFASYVSGVLVFALYLPEILTGYGGAVFLAHDAEVDSMLNGILYLPITTLFPTICYMALLGVVALAQGLARLFGGAAKSFLEWLSTIPAGRIAWVGSGIAGVVVMFEAFAVYLRV